MPKMTADELARDILARSGVKADRGPSIGARCSTRQTAYLFSLIAPERIGHVGGNAAGPRVGHGDGWTLSECTGMLVADGHPTQTMSKEPTPAHAPWLAPLVALYADDAAQWTMEQIQARLEAARRALAARRDEGGE